MPKAKKYSNKHRRRRNNKTKRGGMEQPKPYVPFYDPKTGKPKNTGAVKFYNISKGETPIQPKIQPLPSATIEEVHEVFNNPNPEEMRQIQRDKNLQEYDTIMKKYNDKLEEECYEENCNISGGLKSRKYRKHRKSRKSRKSRKH